MSMTPNVSIAPAAPALPSHLQAQESAQQVTHAPFHPSESDRPSHPANPAHPDEDTGGTALTRTEVYQTNEAPATVPNLDTTLRDDVDLQPAAGHRCDLSDPSTLEVRGLTGQKIPATFAISHPQWQSQLWSEQTIHKNTIAAKLRIAGRNDLAELLEACHSTWTVATCRNCGRTQHFPNRCDNFFCAECQPRLSHDRDESVSWWALRVSEPKLVTLTCKNIPDLHPDHLKEFKQWWTKLRHRKFARNWRGGFYSIEVTNSNRGWHLHLHALIDARWIDAIGLRDEWRSVTNGLGSIVDVKDARREDYLRKVKSYVVKGTMLAAWTPDQILTFITAFDGQRTFGVFGDLYGARTEFADWIKTIRDKKPLCECGSSNISYQSEADWLASDFSPNNNAPARPPPPPPDPLELNLNVTRNWSRN
jgi:hypothetical protein